MTIGQTRACELAVAFLRNRGSLNPRVTNVQSPGQLTASMDTEMQARIPDRAALDLCWIINVAVNDALPISIRVDARTGEIAFAGRVTGGPSSPLANEEL